VSQINADDVNNVGCEASGHFGNGKWIYLKDKINECESYRKNIRDLHRGITIKKVCQPRIYLIRIRTP
jgi:hypothetical protein